MPATPPSIALPPRKRTAEEERESPPRTRAARKPKGIHAPLEGSSFDAVIVGGGPGGAAAAYWLARAGRKVLIVDKAKFPREKVCGDGLTPRAVRCLEDMDVKTEGPEWSRVDGLRIKGSGLTLDLAWPELQSIPHYGLVRTRLDFDSMLLDHAKAAGATVWEETSVEGPLTDATGVVTGVEVARNGDRASVEAPVTIAADGASSRFAMTLGGHRLEGRPMGVAARTYYRSPKAAELTYFESYLDLWRGDDLLPGYGWIFPLPDGTVNVGLGMLSTSRHFQQHDYRKLLDEWATALPGWDFTPESQIGKPRGGPLPMGFNRTPLARPGLMVIGDAAGAVNPFNGEGIAYAMEMAKIAAEVAGLTIDSGDPRALRAYTERLKDAYNGYFIMGRVFTRLLGKDGVMGALTKYALPNRVLMQFAFRILGNLTDPTDGDAYDRVVNGLAKIAPGIRRAVKG